MGIDLSFVIYLIVLLYAVPYIGLGLLYSLEFLHILQLKEYRLSRIFDFVASPKGRNQLLFHPIYPISGIFLFLQSGIKANIFWLYLLVLLFFWLSRIFLRKIYRPVFTKKALLLTLLALIGELLSGTVVLYLLMPINSYNILTSLGIILIFALFRPLWLLVWSQIFQIPTQFAKKHYIAKATKKLATYTDLRVIGITGSYGKTSTRNFLVQILSTKYTVATTTGNINTEIGVARFILNHDFANDDVFVVEMGAYRKGEIKLIADMVLPEIGIITTVGAEHLALFGSIENIRDTKGELFNVLPKKGLAITNADNAHCRALAKTTTAAVQTFGTAQIQRPSLLIRSVEQEADGIRAVINILDHDIELSAPLYGVHNAANLSAAYLAATHIGMEIEDVVAAIRKLTPTQHRLERKVLENNVTVLDDTYNSNPNGFVEALELLALQEQSEKIVLTRGMIELGKKSKEEHVKIGKKIGGVASKLIIISADNAEALAAGATETNPNIVIEHIYDMRAVIERYRAIIDAGNTAVLLENKVPFTIS